ncbi:MAG: XRE family transcriptional regulator [Chitinophagaceae bacterium]|nr:MAG: XRE family transcriptional regulator [Chitinophagaceae bacterium]
MSTLKIKTASDLRSLRKKEGLTAREIAERMEVSLRRIQKIESGTENLTIVSIVRFCDALGLTCKITFVKNKKESTEFIAGTRNYN